MATKKTPNNTAKKLPKMPKARVITEDGFFKSDDTTKKSSPKKSTK